MTLCIDSLFWGRIVWPEGAVLLFNTVDNRSGEWGTSPLHWYFSSALPRALSSFLPVALSAPLVGRPPFRRLVLPAVAFVALYSLLPHKELRFIFFALPLFNAAAAVVMARLWAAATRRPAGTAAVCAAAVMAAVVVAAAAVTAVGVAMAAYNYPGGQAITWLHNEYSGQSGAAFIAAYGDLCRCSLHMYVCGICGLVHS